MDTFLIIMGICAYLSILSSFLTGMKIIKVKFKVHRYIGIIGFSFATVHALFMLYYTFF